MKLASFNYFDGGEVVADLEARPHLWRSAIMGNFGTSLELRALRDMNKGVYLVDTLMILTTNEHTRALQRLARTWKPTEAWWLNRKETEKHLGVYPATGAKILRVWWS